MAKAGFNSKTPKIWLGLVSINRKNPTAAGCTRQGLFVNRTRSIESCDSFPLKQPCPCCVNKFIPPPLQFYGNPWLRVRHITKRMCKVYYVQN